MKNDQEFVENLVHVVEQNYANPDFDVNSMAAKMKASNRQLQRKVKALTGRTPVQYVRNFRLEKSLSCLREGIPIGETARIIGFSSHTYFTYCFKVQFGMTPQQAHAESIQKVGIDDTARKPRDTS